MKAMNLFYEYNKDAEELTLELKQLRVDQEPMLYATVGEVHSVELHWSKKETLRLHVIATRHNNAMVTEHYQVFGIGAAGLAYTVPQRAWDKWRMWSEDKVEGIHQDKRLIFMILGDRGQIRNRSLKGFAKMSFEQVNALQINMEPGKMLVRPTIEEAGLDEGPSPVTPPPVLEVSSSSSSGSSPRPLTPEEIKRQAERPLPSQILTRARMYRGTSSYQGEPSKKKSHFVPMADFRFRNPHPSNRYIHMGPDGPLPKVLVDGMGALLKECIEGPSFATTALIRRAERYHEEKAEQEAKAKREAEEVVTVEEEPEESFCEETSVEDSDKSKDASGVFDITGVSSLDQSNVKEEDSSLVASSSDWEGPFPMDDSVEVFLAKKLNKSQVVNVSTDSSVLEISKGKISDSSMMDF